MPYTILILDSVRDDNAARREDQIKVNLDLREHRFEYFYVAEYAPLDETRPMRVRIAQSQRPVLDEQDLLRRLRGCIDEAHPDILIVQSGPMVHNHPEQVWSTLQALKVSHPQLRIGFHARPFERHRPKPFLEYTNEMGQLMAAIA